MNISISDILRDALNAYKRDDQATCAAVLERLKRRLHRGNPQEAYVLVYADADETKLDVERSAQLMWHWMNTANSSPWTNANTPVYKIGEARREPRAVVHSERDLIAAALGLVDSGVRATDPNVAELMPGFSRK